MSQPASFKTKIASYTERNRLRSELKALSGVQWKTVSEQYCEYRLDGTTVDGKWLRAKQYTNGTYWVQSNEEALLERALVSLGLRSSAITTKSGGNTSSSSPSASPQLSSSYIGTDESGKGDYFGPLVIAGVFVTEETANELARIGAKDCKALKDSDVLRLAPQVIDVVGEDAFATQVWRPEGYNQNIEALKQHGKTLNDLMAAGHAKVIERIDGQLNEKNTEIGDSECRMAVVDQFSTKPLVQQVLKRTGLSVMVRQETKAEDKYIAVAAASIIARATFLQTMEELSAEIGVNLPKGAGTHVNRVAKKLWREQGECVVRSVSKWHFKTTETVRALL